MEKKLKELSREKLSEIILKMSELLTKEQYQALEAIVEERISEGTESGEKLPPARMSQEFVDEKMGQLKIWMDQIDDGELCLDAEEYEDYSESYWDREWITDYYDNEGVGDKITSVIQFAKDCVDDRRYEEANFIYEWLWEMCVCVNSECDSEPADLEVLAENGIIRTDLKQLALLALYADYQAQDAENRAEDLYLYFKISSFRELHIEDMFHVGRENLTGTEQFWKDWIELLKTKSGDMEGRLLQEAVLYMEGARGLLKIADENSRTHPSLYLAAMKECEKTHDYSQIEEIGERAAEKINSRLVVRGEAALKAAYASSCLMHTEKMMWFCWECFRSDPTDRNFLRLFGMEEMAKLYGMRGKEVLGSRIKPEPAGFFLNRELQTNAMSDSTYYTLCFYTGDFKTVWQASKNPQGSLGWSGRFISRGIRLFLLYLYENAVPSEAAKIVAREVGFSDEMEPRDTMKFESEMLEESRRNNTSLFWNYFQHWKSYFPMEEKERKQYLSWAEKIVYSRAGAIVGGQHRRHYGDVAVLLAMVADIKEGMGVKGAKTEIFAEYKKKFPRHSSFQGEMKRFFGK